MDLRALVLARIERLYPGDTYRSGMMQALHDWPVLPARASLDPVLPRDRHLPCPGHLRDARRHSGRLFLFFLRVCFVPESLALLLTVVAAWFYALLTGWLAPCTRAASGLTLVLIAGYFYRERRPLNLLAAVALGFLVFDPEQMFDASFQLTFLAVAFLGAFATPLIRATSGPLARGLQDLGDTGRDIHLPPRIAQFRIEMRQLAETARRVAHLPARVAMPAVAVTGRLLLFFYEITVISAVIQAGLALAHGGLLPPRRPLGPFGQRFRGSADGPGRAPRIRRRLHRLGVVAKIAGVLLWLSQKVVYWHASIEPAWRIPTPPVWLGVAFSAALIAAALARGRWWRTGTGLAVAVFLALLLWHPFRRRPPRRTGDDRHRRGTG